jgi:hypothetical protein
LSAIEHERWADWQKYLHSKLELQPIDDAHAFNVLPHEWRDRWERQIPMPYAQLSEAEKQSDRDQVMRYWPTLVAFVAEWLVSREGVSYYGFSLNPDDLWTLSRWWREDMESPEEQSSDVTPQDA